MRDCWFCRISQRVADDAAGTGVTIGLSGQAQFRLASGQFGDDLWDLATPGPGGPVLADRPAFEKRTARRRRRIHIRHCVDQVQDRYEAEWLEVLFNEAPVPVQAVGDERFVSRLEQARRPRASPQHAAELARVTQCSHDITLQHLRAQREPTIVREDRQRGLRGRRQQCIQAMQVRTCREIHTGGFVGRVRGISLQNICRLLIELVSSRDRGWGGRQF